MWVLVLLGLLVSTFILRGQGFEMNKSVAYGCAIMLVFVAIHQHPHIVPTLPLLLYGAVMK